MSNSRIRWLEWGREAFKLAERLDRPILLKIGATWCHWCHVMDDTTYSDEAVVEFVNKEFVSIAVDTDSRPDVNERYNMGGWPTTAFLTPDGEIITGGTYLPPYHFLGVAEEVLNHYRKNKGKIEENGYQKIEVAQEAGELGWEIVEEVAGEIIDIFDPLYGGFGYDQKFPQPDLLDLLLLYSGRRGDDASRAAVILTLDAMMEGEIWDRDRGGFYRYATHRDWSAPHFEKMLEDNARLLLTFLDAHLLTGYERYRSGRGYPCFSSLTPLRWCVLWKH